MRKLKLLLILPPNDPEAVMILKIAEALSIPTMISRQQHGASLDKGTDVVQFVKKGGYKNVIVIEMPGPKTEARLRKLGVTLTIIDHHEYTGLDRAHDARGRLLPSSLEQFLKRFRLTDAKLKALGFDPRLVRGIGIMDRGYVWALKEEGYSRRDTARVLKLREDLMSPYINTRTEKNKQAAAKRAWASKKKWREYLVIQSRANVQLRPRVSMLVAVEIGKPTPLIIVEHGRGLIYVQESDAAATLFKQFGGFTFGMGRNWGYRNEKGHPRVGLKEVQEFLASL